jgi:hypothetical protein
MNAVCLPYMLRGVPIILLNLIILIYEDLFYDSLKSKFQIEFDFDFSFYLNCRAQNFIFVLLISLFTSSNCYIYSSSLHPATISHSLQTLWKCDLLLVQISSDDPATWSRGRPGWWEDDDRGRLSSRMVEWMLPGGTGKQGGDHRRKYFERAEW